MKMAAMPSEQQHPVPLCSARQRAHRYLERVPDSVFGSHVVNRVSVHRQRLVCPCDFPAVLDTNCMQVSGRSAFKFPAASHAQSSSSIDPSFADEATAVVSRHSGTNKSKPSAKKKKKGKR